LTPLCIAHEANSLAKRTVKVIDPPPFFLRNVELVHKAKTFNRKRLLRSAINTLRDELAYRLRNDIVATRFAQIQAQKRQLRDLEVECHTDVDDSIAISSQYDNASRTSYLFEPFVIPARNPSPVHSLSDDGRTFYNWVPFDVKTPIVHPVQANESIDDAILSIDSTSDDETEPSESSAGSLPEPPPDTQSTVLAPCPGYLTELLAGLRERFPALRNRNRSQPPPKARENSTFTRLMKTASTVTSTVSAVIGSACSGAASMVASLWRTSRLPAPEEDPSIVRDLTRSIVPTPRSFKYAADVLEGFPGVAENGRLLSYDEFAKVGYQPCG